MSIRAPAFAFFLFVLLALVARSGAEDVSVTNYFREPAGVPFDEAELETGVEEGWNWTRFRYTSMIYEGQPVRIHALYAAPAHAGPNHQVPAIVMTHGKFGRINRKDSRYWSAVSDLVKAGYAVLFFEWNPDPQIKETGERIAEPSYATFGAIDYSRGWDQPDDDWRRSMSFQAVIAGRRAITWVSARPEVDPTRIGATGASYGGIFSSLLAAIDLRIKAVSPTVYAAGFGPEERGYNRLSPKKFTADQAKDWQSRFDAQVLLNRRTEPLPLLHIVSTNDTAFDLPKTSRHFAALPEPKSLVICPNAGHDFWNFRQTILFFDEIFQQGARRPKTGRVTATESGGSWKLAVPTEAPCTFHYTLEQPGDASGQEPALRSARWTKLPARLQNGVSETELRLTPEAVRDAKRLHVFALARSENGLESSSPLLSLELPPRPAQTPHDRQ